MKKFFLGLFLISFAFAGYQNTKTETSLSSIKKIVLTKEEEKKYIEEFKKEPVRYIFSIYDDYHFNRVDQGIKKAKALLNYLNTKNPNDEIKSPYLRWKKVYQIKSTVYTLLGLLYTKKAGEVDSALREKERKYILEVLRKKGKLTKEDLDYLASLSREEDLEQENNSKFYIDKAVNSFKKAISIFPDNPYPYYQLAKFYKESEENKLAQKYLEKAAKLFLKYNQKDMFYSLLEDAKKEGFSKDFIKKLEAMQK